MDMKELITPERICLLKDTKKSEVLIDLTELAFSTSNELQDLENLKKDIFFREELMSTGIGMGLGIPHLRMEGITDPIICIGVQKQGIYDYQSLDDTPVQVVIMILVGKEQHSKYIRILSQLTGKLKSKSLIPKLVEASTENEIYDALIGE